jgi:hypothetical protein
MSSKGPWESRVGTLIDPAKYSDFVWSYKPVDSKDHGGAVRIDWLACDIWGLLWMIEVKQTTSGRLTFNLLDEISPLQRQALSSVALSANGMSVLAIGQEKNLYLFDWRTLCLQWRIRELSPNPKPYLLPLNTALAVLTYGRKDTWATSIRLRDIFANKALRLHPEDVTARMLIKLTGFSTKIERLPSTLKPEDYILTQELMRRLGQSSAGSAIRISSSDLFPTGGLMS